MPRLRLPLGARRPRGPQRGIRDEPKIKILFKSSPGAVGNVVQGRKNPDVEKARLGRGGEEGAAETLGR